MSAQANTTSAVAPFWSGWQSAVINGVYPLQRLLNGSERSAVFSSECKGLPVANVAVKIIPIERVTLAQLSHWRFSTGLSHPRLVRLFDAGLCQLGGQPFLFVVMEYAEQTLSQVLSQRPLTAEEVREMLPPTLEALAFLHSQGLVHSHLSPSNLLVVNDQLKLSSDSIRPAGAPRVGIAEPSLHVPPEAAHAAFSSAGDIWGLGVTLAEALTQGLPSLDEHPGAAVLPTTVAPEFVGMLQRCLNYDPAARPSATDLQAELGCAPQAPRVQVPPTVVPEIPRDAPIAEPPRQRGPIAALVAAVFLILLAAVWADLHLFHSAANPAQATAVTPQASVPQPAAMAQATAQNPTAHLPEPGVVREALPTVPRRALGTIHGRIRIAVLVVVDHFGAVIEAHLKNTGPSAYFARLAREAARKWTFVAVDDPDSRKWVVQFEFTHSGVTGNATPAPAP
ncbi:MAG TPA: protein kinase [Steroidobacteraceae bacterium]|jgi:hypothetical protein|nr:protein kinase [Steroidobacteraceae bacterium]